MFTKLYKLLEFYVFGQIHQKIGSFCKHLTSQPKLCLKTFFHDRFITKFVRYELNLKGILIIDLLSSSSDMNEYSSVPNKRAARLFIPGKFFQPTWAY